MNLRSLVCGSGFFFICQLLSITLSVLLSALPWASLIVGALGVVGAGSIAAYLAPQEKIRNSFLAGMISALLLGLIVLVLPYTGVPSDNLGVFGAYIVTLLYLPLCFCLSVGGGVMVVWMMGKSMRK